MSALGCFRQASEKTNRNNAAGNTAHFLLIVFTIHMDWIFLFPALNYGRIIS